MLQKKFIRVVRVNTTLLTCLKVGYIILYDQLELDHLLCFLLCCSVAQFTSWYWFICARPLPSCLWDPPNSLRGRPSFLRSPSFFLWAFPASEALSAASKALPALMILIRDSVSWMGQRVPLATQLFSALVNGHSSFYPYSSFCFLFPLSSDFGFLTFFI